MLHRLGVSRGVRTYPHTDPGHVYTDISLSQPSSVSYGVGEGGVTENSVLKTVLRWKRTGNGTTRNLTLTLKLMIYLTLTLTSTTRQTPKARSRTNPNPNPTCFYYLLKQHKFSVSVSSDSTEIRVLSTRVYAMSEGWGGGYPEKGAKIGWRGRDDLGTPLTENRGVFTRSMG